MNECNYLFLSSSKKLLLTCNKIPYQFIYFKPNALMQKHLNYHGPKLPLLSAMNISRSDIVTLYVHICMSVHPYIHHFYEEGKKLLPTIQYIYHTLPYHIPTYATMTIK